MDEDILLPVTEDFEPFVMEHNDPGQSPKSGGKSSKPTISKEEESFYKKLLGKDDEDDTFLPIEDEIDFEPKNLNDDEGKKGTPKPKDNTGINKGSNKKDSFPLSVKELFNDLKSKNVLSVDIPEEIDDSEDSILNLFSSQLEKDRRELIQSLDNKHDGLLTFLENGGNLEDFKKVMKEATYDSIKEDDILSSDELMEKAYKDFFLRKGISEQLVNKNLRRAKDLDELKEEVKEILPQLKEMDLSSKEALKNKVRLEHETREKQITELMSNINKHIDELEEFLPSKKLSVKDKEELKKIATSNKVFEKLNADPVKARALLAAFDYYGLLDNKWDNVVNTVTTKVVNETKNKYLKSRKSSGGEVESQGELPDVLSAFANTYLKRR